MSQVTQTHQPGSAHGGDPKPPMSGIARAERIATTVGVVLAVVAAAYLLFQLFSEHEVCYGVRADQLLCQPVDAMAAGRAVLVLMYPGILLAVAALGAFWQTRATEPGARSTAYGLLVTSTVVLVGIVVPAVAGAGMYLLPGTALMVIASALGTVKFIQDFRARATETTER